jgi:hypothetical protein
MLVSELLEASLRKIGGMSSGETIETTRQAEALSALKSMLRAWGGKSINVFATVHEEVSLVAGTTSYSWGSGGDINTARPTKIVQAYLVSGTSSSPVQILTEGKYARIGDKTITGPPSSILYRPTYPLGLLYTVPIADSSYTLNVFSIKSFTESGSFTLVTDEIDFPLMYEEPIIYNLAIRLAPEYGRNVSAEVAEIAKTSYNDLVALNASMQVESIPLAELFPAGITGFTFDINAG